MSRDMIVPGGDTASLRPLSPTEAPAATLSLLVFSARGAMAAHRLTRPLVAGRTPSCEIALDDAAASREHARLVPQADGVEVADLGSHNGTFVDGRPVTRALVRPGGLVRLGDTLLRVARLTEEWQAADAAGPLVGGTAVAPVRRLIALVGPTELAVLVLGETGTGKEVVAHLLHAASGRAGPFVAVNCAALPEALVESELFGHVPGAFTGATRVRQGLVSVAAGGTLFLDEVGELPPAAQAKLLRVLEDGIVRPVGAASGRKVDLRVLSATNRDLARAAAEGRFRADLLARLGAVEARLPPLRERPEDLPALAAYLLGRAGHAGLALEGNALEALALYDWPQNVRELDHVLRSAALAQAGTVGFEHLPPRLQDALTRARRRTDASVAAGLAPERARLEAALRATGGNVRRASRELGLARSQMYRLLARWRIDLGAVRGRGTNLAD